MNAPAIVSDGVSPEIMQQVLVTGNLANLSPEQRLAYYAHRCRQAGLDPAAQPFEYITLNGKLKLYALKAATDQLTGIHKLSSQILTREARGPIYEVTVRVTGPDGRFTDEMGAVPIENLRGDDLANALLKAHTKAKRRAVLAHLGLGMLDETEVETIRDAKPGNVAQSAPPPRGQGMAPPAPPKPQEAPKPQEKPITWEGLVAAMLKEQNGDPVQWPKVGTPRWREAVDCARDRMKAVKAQHLAQVPAEWLTARSVELCEVLNLQFDGRTQQYTGELSPYIQFVLTLTEDLIRLAAESEARANEIQEVSQ